MITPTKSIKSHPLFSSLNSTPVSVSCGSLEEDFCPDKNILYKISEFADDDTRRTLKETCKFYRNTLNIEPTFGRKNAEYLLIHIVESAMAKRLGSDALDLETKSDFSNLELYSNDLNKLGFKNTIQLGYGNRAKEISKIINENKIDLLVMGAHGHAGLSDIVFGSTVDSVRHLVKIPVLVVN
jgi:hypothetical protein